MSTPHPTASPPFQGSNSKTTVSLSLTLKADVARVAKENHCSEADIIRLAIEAYCARRRPRATVLTDDEV